MLSIREARKLRQKKHREQQRAFLLEGPRALEEALASHTTLRGVFVSSESREKYRSLTERCDELSLPLREVSERELSSLCGSQTPQGIVGVCELCDVSLEDLTQSTPRFLVVGVQISDPGNAGAVIRVADAAGADGVIFTTDSVDIYNDKCVRATTGSMFHLPLVRGADAHGVVAMLRASGIRTLGTSSHAQRSLFDVADTGQLCAPTAWVFGSEAHGVPQGMMEDLDETVTIPIYGRAESLNLATAAAVCLYTHARALRS